MTTFRVTVGPHYTPTSDVYTVEAEDENDAVDMTCEDAKQEWREFDWECSVEAVEAVS